MEIPYGYCHCGCGRKTRLADSSCAARHTVKNVPLRFVHGHRPTTIARWKTEDRGYITPCWIWLMAVNARGYGNISSEGTTFVAHKYYYEKKFGPIPDGKIMDHLCEVRLCVNPDHLEPVTIQVNVQRGNSSKLCPDDIREIRAMIVSGVLCKDIAPLFGVKPSCISGIKTGRKWGNIA